MSKYIKLEDAISKIVNTPTRVITDDLTALADRQHEIIDMLADLPTIEVEDAISRTEFIEMIKGMITDATSHGISPRLDPHFVISMVKSAPSVIPEDTEEFKNFDREDLILLIECQKERIGELLADKDTPQTD